MGQATANLGASIGWGAAGAVCAPFVALLPPLWLVPAYCGLRSARSFGRSVYNAGCATVPLMTDAQVMLRPRLQRALRDATVMHAAGRWFEAAQQLAPLLTELRDLGAHLPRHALASSWQPCVRLYEAALRAYVADMPHVQANQQRLSQALCSADDDAFMKIFSAMPATEQRLAAYMSADSDASARLVDLAIAHDCSRAWEALHAQLQEPDAVFEAWVHPLREHASNVYALGRRSLREQLPKLARAMVLRSEVTAAAYMEAFARYAHDDHPVVRAAVLSFVQAQRITAGRALKGYPDRHLLAQLLEAKQVTIAEVAALGLPNLRAALVDMLGTTQEGAQQLCEAHVLSKQEVLQLVRADLLTPSMAARHYAVGHEAASTWYAAGRLPLADYISCTAEGYEPQRPLDAAQITFAESFHTSESDPTAVAARLTALWDALRPIGLDTANRRSFMLRMSAVALAGPAAATPATNTTALQTPQTCVVCFEPFDGERPSVHGSHCEHAPSVCAACTAEQARVNGSARCAAAPCAMVLSPNDLLAAHVPTARIDAICADMVRVQLATVPNWRTCWTQGCVGGAQVPRGTHQSFCCPVCTSTASLTSRVLDTQKDIEYARRLIANLGNISTMTGALRECYWCGTGTEHGDACSHMACTTCKRDWDFNRGDMQGNHAGPEHLRSQAYVPHAGLLLDAGLYDGLLAGSYNHPQERVAEHVRTQARARGLL